MDLEECVQVGDATSGCSSCSSVGNWWKIRRFSPKFSPNQNLMWNREWEELDLERKMLGMRFYLWLVFHGNGALNEKYFIVRASRSKNGFVREKIQIFEGKYQRKKNLILQKIMGISPDLGSHGG